MISPQNIAFTTGEASARTRNIKEDKILSKHLEHIDLQKTYSSRLHDLDIRVVVNKYSAFKDRVRVIIKKSSIRSTIVPEKIAKQRCVQNGGTDFKNVNNNVEKLTVESRPDQERTNHSSENRYMLNLKINVYYNGTKSGSMKEREPVGEPSTKVDNVSGVQQKTKGEAHTPKSPARQRRYGRCISDQMFATKTFSLNDLVEQEEDVGQRINDRIEGELKKNLIGSVVPGISVTRPGKDISEIITAEQISNDNQKNENLDGWNKSGKCHTVQDSKKRSTNYKEVNYASECSDLYPEQCNNTSISMNHVPKNYSKQKRAITATNRGVKTKLMQTVAERDRPLTAADSNSSELIDSKVAAFLERDYKNLLISDDTFMSSEQKNNTRRQSSSISHRSLSPGTEKGLSDSVELLSCSSSSRRNSIMTVSNLSQQSMQKTRKVSWSPQQRKISTNLFGINTNGSGSKPNDSMVRFRKFSRMNNYLGKFSQLRIDKDANIPVKDLLKCRYLRIPERVKLAHGWNEDQEFADISNSQLRAMNYVPFRTMKGRV